jgi:four helix bundle protein
LGDFKNLTVWVKAHALTVDLYKATQRFPRDEIFGLTAQMRRASSSIGANLAEGCGRKSDPEFRRFIHLAMGSSSELENHLLLSRDLKLLSKTDFERLTRSLGEVSKMLK